MDNPSVVIGREHALRPGFFSQCKAIFFRKANGGQRTGAAEPFRYGDGRSFQGGAERLGPLHGHEHLFFRRIQVDIDLYGFLVRMVSDARLFNVLARVFSQEKRVGQHLKAITGPWLLAFPGFAFFMLANE